MKTPKSPGAIYIYIYIISFNKINMTKHRKEAMYFRRI